ncbi:alpha/beta fold hydrolase [Lysobacter sp. Root983]|uniref:esterase/lipase family protein n=1 Tax=Lysobacter sp. Root983 TaxID=1736613 RepID=UPI0007111702|nr:alpha/beta fold hydrolase [Lysobacter sp. Root983]KRD77263.1 hypothetical protein ASE43_08885 [Lysobacter sp. Root983]
MKRESQAAYADPADYTRLGEEALVVHQRSPVSANDSLLVFVHGLGGSRYGPGATWGRFPAFLYDDLPEVDVGMYQYRTAAGRWAWTRSIALEDEARVLADLIRDQLKAYKRIVLIGHSMGGLLCKATIHRLLETGEHDALNRIAGLLLMATPQLGALRVPGWLGAFSLDARALRPHGELVRKINLSFENHIALDERVSTLRRTTIPTWAVEAVYDRWVDSLSAGIGLTSSRIKVVRGSHTSIVKPDDRDSDVYAWVRERIGIALDRFKYDVFVAAAMAGHSGDAEYADNRATVLAMIEVLKQRCGYTSVFYAGATMPTMEDFDPEELALRKDMAALRESRHFILFYPKRIVSSVLYEAGWALILGKPSIYIVGDDQDLPFLMQEASQAFVERRVRIFECPDRASVLERLTAYGPELFDASAA